jgi:predicted DCC family thiol-disulfide oxidoreductase YuxK
MHRLGNRTAMENRDLKASVMNSVILFDDACLLCNGVVRFILANDLRGIFSFAALRSDAAHELMREKHNKDNFNETMVLIEGDARFVRSEAILRIARRLQMPWPLLGVLAIVPKIARDKLYCWIAHHRYCWFGRTDASSTGEVLYTTIRNQALGYQGIPAKASDRCDMRHATPVQGAFLQEPPEQATRDTHGGVA